MTSKLIRIVTIHEDTDYSGPTLYALDDCGRLWRKAQRSEWVELNRPGGMGAKSDPSHAVRCQLCDLFVWDQEGTKSIGVLDTSGRIRTYRQTIEGDVWDEIRDPWFGVEARI